MSWLGWSLVALFCWGTWAVLNKLALRTLEWPHLLVTSWLAHTAVVTVLFFSRLDPRPLVSRDGALAGAAALTSLVAVTSFYLALRTGTTTAVTLLSSLYPAVTTVLAVAFLREQPSTFQWAGIVLAVLAGVLLTRP